MESTKVKQKKKLLYHIEVNELNQEDFMIKSLIFNQINKYLKDYLYGFDKHQIEVGLLNGHLEMKNVNLKPDKINTLLTESEIPLVLKCGMITNLKLDVPSVFEWTEIVGQIDEVLFIFGPNLHGLNSSEV